MEKGVLLTKETSRQQTRAEARYHECEIQHHACLRWQTSMMKLLLFVVSISECRLLEEITHDESNFTTNAKVDGKVKSFSE